MAVTEINIDVKRNYDLVHFVVARDPGNKIINPTLRVDPFIPIDSLILRELAESYCGNFKHLPRS